MKHYFGFHCNGGDVRETMFHAFHDRGIGEIGSMRIRNDNGTQLVCNTVEEFLAMMNIGHERIHPQTPKEDAHIESFNSILEREVIRFKLRDRNGQVTVKYGPNEDPVGLGLQHLNLKRQISGLLGFPVIEARIQYPGKGYDAFMGWIQIVRFRLNMADGGYRSNLIEIVDWPQCFNGADSPFSCYGHKPTFFDAPSVGYGGIKWEAHTWLAEIPDAVMGRTIRPVLGFSWGYFREKEGPELARLNVLNVDNWKEDVKVLERSCRKWKFAGR